MGWVEITALIFSGIALIYAIYRDKNDEVDELITRVSKMETKVEVHDTEIQRLKKGQDELEDTIKSLQGQIHNLDLKIERILTILENQKGA